MISPKQIPVKRLFFFLFVFAILTVGGLYFRSRAQLFSSQLKKQKSDVERLDKEKAELKNLGDRVAAEYSKLQQDYEGLRATNERLSLDRDNLMRRIKELLGESNLARDLEVKFEKAGEDIENLEKENQELVEQNLVFKEENKDLKDLKAELVKEKQSLSDQLKEERDKSGIAKLQDEIAALKNENAGLSTRLKQAESESVGLKLSQSQLIKDKAQLGEKLSQLTKFYDEAVLKNKRLEQRVNDLPEKYAAIAAQNKTLLRDSANMHYNLGIFYSRQKDYERSAMEFRKCLELAPSDAQAHFNLGYIYAEHLPDRQKAIEHFRYYLRYAKSGDKDIDWAKRYLITWPVWDATDPVQ